MRPVDSRVKLLVIILRNPLHHHPNPLPAPLYFKMVSSSRRAQRKAHFDAPAHLRRKIMSASLNKELRAEHGVSISPMFRNRTGSIIDHHTATPSSADTDAISQADTSQNTFTNDSIVFQTLDTQHLSAEVPPLASRQSD